MPRPSEVISIFDPAIKSPPKEAHEYTKHRDLSRLKYDPAKATVFMLREIPNELMEPFVMNGLGEADIYKRAFQAAVVGVRNLHTTEQIHREWKPARVNDLVAEEDLVHFSGAERSEIGKVAFTCAFLPRRTEPTFALPHMSLAEWADQSTLSLAGSSPASPAPNSGAASSGTPAANPASGETASATRGSGDGSESRTDATAEDRAA